MRERGVNVGAREGRGAVYVCLVYKPHAQFIL